MNLEKLNNFLFYIEAAAFLVALTLILIDFPKIWDLIELMTKIYMEARP